MDINIQSDAIPMDQLLLGMIASKMNDVARVQSAIVLLVTCMKNGDLEPVLKKAEQDAPTNPKAKRCAQSIRDVLTIKSRLLATFNDTSKEIDKMISETEKETVSPF